MSEAAASLPSLAPILRGYSVEISAQNEKVVDSAVERLERGTEVYFTWIPGEDFFRTIQPAAKLSRAGLLPVPHIGVRHLDSTEQLDDLLGRFAGEAGVDRVLLIGGERDKPLGPYDATLQVMQSGLLEKHHIRRAGISGFPEGHPKISDQVLAESVVEKMRYARQAGLTLHIVTQFVFEGEPIAEWLKRIRAMGVDLPVRVGLAGPAGIATLTRYALHCGVGNSIRALTKSASFGRLLTERDPEPVIRELMAAAPGGDTSVPPFGVVALHFYTFGGLKKTVEWINEARGNTSG
ncbi:MAG TPA: methylenetetrahydrofolate reductase [Candidatus Acidoferrales bacterium]|nr:methylenetetrahydrofolate reductase [Candidatus Acidoferrales bacterium]